jgi:hypothetical protein
MQGDQEVTTHKLYQHIQVFGRPTAYIVRFGNDADTDEVFTDYASAMLRVVEYCIGSIPHTEGRKR